VAHPLVDDAARWWRAYLLAEEDRADELRQRADAGDDHAWPERFDWLAWHDLDELRALAATLDGRPRQLLTRWLARQGNIEVLRIGADAGDDHAQRMLAHWLARHGLAEELHRRADAGDDHARERLTWLRQQP
jgi:hypothetical protein